MGSFLSYIYGTEEEYPEYETNNQTIEKELIDFSHLDELSKEELIEYIKQLKPKNLNYSVNFVDKMRNIELENSNLVPMCIELYKKMFDEFGEYKPDASIPQKKRPFFVKPKFDTETVKKTISNLPQAKMIPFDKDLVKIPVSNVSLKMENITVEEFTNSFNNNIAKKDMMGISKNVLRDMPNYMKIRFVNEFNKILTNPSRGKDNSFGKGSYIYKAAKHGPTSDINSFRQIVSIPNGLNQFHRLLTIRLTNYLQANKYLDTTIQKGCILGEKNSIFQQFYKVKNIMKHAHKNKKSCAVLFLDMSNAFGNLNLANLYSIMELYGISDQFVAYIKEFYSNFQYYVDSGSIKTGLFKWNDGLIQGCSLSPLLFVLAMNYVLTHIDTEYKNACGYDIDGTTKILLTAFVDDVCVICRDQATLEIVYKKLNDLLKMIGLPVNKSKCAIMVVNDATGTLTGELKEIQKVNTFKYLGEYISSDGSSTESYIQFLKYVTRRLKLIDDKKMSSQEKLKTFETHIVPWIQRKTMAMYDISVTNRLKIVAIIKPYMEKWEHSGLINIFSNITPILNDSKDAIISSVKFEDNDFDDELEQNIEMATYVLKDANIKLDYNQIDNEYQIDMELEEVDFD